MKFVDKDLKAVQEARVLMEDAAEAKKTLALFEQKQLDCIVDHMLDAIFPKLEQLTRQAVQETGYGCEKDELLLCTLLVKKLKDCFLGMDCVGILSQDEQKGVLEIGVPMGIVAAATPAISPVAAVISAAASAIKAGNAIVFTPHPNAAKVTAKAVSILEEGALSAGLPQGALSCIDTAAKEGAMQLFAHPDTAIVLNIGEPKLLEAASAGGRPVLYGGIAPGPVFIEKTANVKQAAKNIVDSRSFNCGIGVGSEQYLVVDKQIAAQAKEELSRCGSYFMSQEEQKKLTTLLGLASTAEDADKAYIGKSAEWLSTKAGFSVPKGTKVLVSEQAYITDYNPYAKGLLCPILAFYIEEDWVHACGKCIELLMGESRGNTLTIHSNDPQVIQQFAMKKPVGRILINTPAVMGAMGITTELFPTVILGSVTARQGITADNVSPMNMIYRRKAAFGIRSFIPKDQNQEEREEMNFGYSRIF